ncbi:MAG: hypothetical protein ACKOW6_02545 [Fluviibacter sp.]
MINIIFLSYKAISILWSFEMATPNKKNSILSTLLFGSQTKHPQGRLIKFDEQTPDIKLSTGTLQERIISALEHTTHPLTSKEIADRIGAAQPRAAAKIKQLLNDGKLAEIKLDGCLSEYILANDPNLIIR